MGSMNMFEGAKNLQINGGTFTQMYGDKGPLQVLLAKSAPGAFHISAERYDPPKCHPDTRVAVLDDIIQQVKIAVVSTIIWLHGAAGAGKSSIAQTIAEMSSEQELLIGSFFFRTSPLRNNMRCLAATLVYQLTQAIPSTRRFIASYIKDNPAIFLSSLEDQLQQLFVQPLCHVYRVCSFTQETMPSHRLLILDGLDECDSPKVQEYILAVLGKVLQTAPIPIVVLVASRPETHISSVFDSPEDRFQVPTISIGLNDQYNADNDVRLYTNAKLKQIKRSHRLRKYIPSTWPTDEDVEHIVQKSSGQFIFAATIIRYVEHVNSKPHERLQMALTSAQRFASRTGSSPFQELDALYTQIFAGVEDIVVALAILYHALCLDDIKYPHLIASRLQLAPGDVEMHISPLASLMQYQSEMSEIRFFHASLGDFLISENRSQGVYLYGAPVATFMLKAYLNQIIDPADRVAWRWAERMRESLEYACPDEELTNGLYLLRDKLPDIINRRKQQKIGFGNLLVWRDRDAHSLLETSRSTICLLLKTLDLFNSALKTLNKGEIFLVDYLQAIHGYFRRHLLEYLPDQGIRDFLAFWIFCPTHSRVFICRDEFNSFASDCFSISERLWTKFSRVLGTTNLENEVSDDILREALSDTALSGNLLSPQELVRVALKCVAYLDPLTSLSAWMGDYLARAHWVLESLTEMLNHTAKDPELIEAIQSQKLYTDRLRKSTSTKYQEAARNYLTTHSSPNDISNSPAPVER